MQFRLTRAVVLVLALALAARRLRQVLHQQHPGAQGLQGRERALQEERVQGGRRRTTRTPSSSTRTSRASPTSSSATATTTCTSRRRRARPKTTRYLQKAVENYKLAIEKLKDDRTRRARRSGSCAFEYLIAAYGTDKLNDFDKAEPVAQQLIAIEPNEPTNYQALGKLYEDAGRYDEAEAQFQKAIDVKPNDADRLPDARRLLQPPGRLREDDGSVRASAPRSSRTTPRPGTRSATYYSGRRSSSDKRLPPGQAARNTSTEGHRGRRQGAGAQPRVLRGAASTRTSCCACRPTSRRTRPSRRRCIERGRRPQGQGRRPPEEAEAPRRGGGAKKGKATTGRPTTVKGAAGVRGRALLLWPVLRRGAGAQARGDGSASGARGRARRACRPLADAVEPRPRGDAAAAAAAQPAREPAPSRGRTRNGRGRESGRAR